MNKPSSVLPFADDGADVPPVPRRPREGLGRVPVVAQTLHDPRLKRTNKNLYRAWLKGGPPVW